MAFLDDIYIVCRPERLAEVHTTVEDQLATHPHPCALRQDSSVEQRCGTEVALNPVGLRR